MSCKYVVSGGLRLHKLTPFRVQINIHVVLWSVFVIRCAVTSLPVVEHRLITTSARESDS